ncbi:hypothetical protein NC653_024835 [Populus alba x Populus x berolinensis]|uniref:Uncharacterized protein n=1 Tax=Populus alba x Populus x berolinensis TaxID=444605 RepID=A0AAD6M9R9_9ROSI|nr:hypothetical protein NC653_024835 [Populus alba x Populus x berolinensis]
MFDFLTSIDIKTKLESVALCQNAFCSAGRVSSQLMTSSRSSLGTFSNHSPAPTKFDLPLFHVGSAVD